jgi:hypothetical protein
MHGLGHINHVATNMLINEIKFVFRLKMWLVFIKITTILKHKPHLIKDARKLVCTPTLN